MNIIYNLFSRIVGIRRDKTERRSSFMELLKSKLPVDIRTLEIGVAAGDFSMYILNNLEVKKHHMVDPWLNEGDNQRSQWFVGKNDANKTYLFVRARFAFKPVKIHREFSSEYFKRNIKNSSNKFDFIYIDGDHHSNAVFNDLENAYKLLKVGGILAGDDYNWVSNSTNKPEVQLGVEKFENKHGLKFNICEGDNGGLNQYWLIKST